MYNIHIRTYKCELIRYRIIHNSIIISLYNLTDIIDNTFIPIHVLLEYIILHNISSDICIS